MPPCLADSSDGFSFDLATSLVITVDTTQSVNTSACSSSAWSDAALAALPASVDLSLYAFRTFILPPSAGAGTCTYGGLGVVGCDANCTTWIRETGAIKHELGHNVGFNHASTDPNNDGGTCLGGEGTVGCV